MNSKNKFFDSFKTRGFEDKRGQLTIFIIIAIIIVAVLLVLFWPKLKIIVTPSSAPQEYIQDCIESDMKEVVERVMLQGGYISPENYIMYDDEKVQYLCYTNQYYERCLIQQPLLRQHIEGEIKKEISSKIVKCVDDFKKEMESRGYSVSKGKSEINIDIVPKNIKLGIETPLTYSKGEESESYEKVRINLKSDIYHLIMMSTSILNWESRYGDSDSLTYMLYYPDLKVEKYKQGDGSTIYILTDRNTKEKFMFASRSVAWPPGWGFGDEHER